MKIKPLSAREIRSLAKKLESTQDELMQLLSRSESDSQPVALDQQAVGRVSRIDAIQQQQMAKAARDLDTLLLAQVSAALQRIENEEFGFCLECGDNIGYGRLEVQPQAAYCVSCQSSMEQE